VGRGGRGGAGLVPDPFFLLFYLKLFEKGSGKKTKTTKRTRK